ncbi:phage integrase SAM-like domain-containing protein [Enterococcus hulanensis]|nr:phage integrase SAM-like domain-containing protein [Enterococcus hulanensis]
MTGQDIEDWIYELSQTATRNSRNQDEIKPLSRNYINRILGHLKIILDRAVREGFINKNPAEDVSSFPKENNKVDF